MNMTFKMTGNEEQLIETTAEIKLSQIYQARPPFRLIAHHEKFQMDDTTSSIFGEKQGYRFKLEYKDNNEKNVREVLSDLDELEISYEAQGSKLLLAE